MEIYSDWVLNKVLQAKSLTFKLLVGNPTNCSQERKKEIKKEGKKEQASRGLTRCWQAIQL